MLQVPLREYEIELGEGFSFQFQQPLPFFLTWITQEPFIGMLAIVSENEVIGSFSAPMDFLTMYFNPADYALNALNMIGVKNEDGEEWELIGDVFGLNFFSSEESTRTVLWVESEPA